MVCQICCVASTKKRAHESRPETYTEGALEKLRVNRMKKPEEWAPCENYGRADKRDEIERRHELPRQTDTFSLEAR
jgi:hypothetical protein